MPRLTRAVPSRPGGAVELVVSDTVKSLLIAVFRDGACCGANRPQQCFRPQFRCALDGVESISTTGSGRPAGANTLRV